MDLCESNVISIISVYVNRCEKCCVHVVALILLSTNPNNPFACQELLKIYIYIYICQNFVSGLLFQCSSQGHPCWLRKRFNSWGSVFVEILFLSFYKKWLWSQNLTLTQRQTSPNISSHATWRTYHICHVENLTPLKNWIAILIKKTYFVFASHILSQLSLLRFEGWLHYWDFHFLNCLENWLG